MLYSHFKVLGTKQSYQIFSPLLSRKKKSKDELIEYIFTLLRQHAPLLDTVLCTVYKVSCHNGI